jgi:hypothetical protein
LESFFLESYSAKVQHLVDAYWKHYELAADDRRQRLEAENWFWAWEEVDGAVRAPGPQTFDLLLALVHAARDDDALAYVGAGPFEDLVNWHGANFVDQIEQCARRDEAFRQALANVRISNNVPATIRDRLAVFIPPLKPTGG